MPQRPSLDDLQRRSFDDASILLVDDSEPWRSNARSFLERETRWTVFEACDGLEAVQMTVELSPDIVLLDINMPGLNGIEAATRIRRLSQDSRIIFLSQHADEHVIAAALKTGALAYVLKSDIVRVLIPAIRIALLAKP